MSSLRANHLFHRSSDGKLLRRKEGIWSSTAAACVDCQTTERPHEAFGRCRLCYLRWKRATDAEWKARKNHLQKLSALRNAEAVEARDKARAKEPRRQAQRRVISNRWADRHSKWPRGSQVLYEWLPQFWITGTVVDKTNAIALVQFATFQERIPFTQLRRVDVDRSVAA